MYREEQRTHRSMLLLKVKKAFQFWPSIEFSQVECRKCRLEGHCNNSVVDPGEGDEIKGLKVIFQMKIISFKKLQI